MKSVYLGPLGREGNGKKTVCCEKQRNEGRGGVSLSEPTGQQSMNTLDDGAVGGGSICQSSPRVIGSRCEAVWPLRQRGVKGRIKSSVQN